MKVKPYLGISQLGIGRGGQRNSLAILFDNMASTSMTAKKNKKRANRLLFRRNGFFYQLVGKGGNPVQLPPRRIL